MYSQQQSAAAAGGSGPSDPGAGAAEATPGEDAGDGDVVEGEIVDEGGA